jgi:cell division protein ZipA
LSNLRLILLALGIFVIGAIWWWTARRSRQAPGNAELREPTLPAPMAPAIGAEAAAEKRAAASQPRASALRATPLERRTAEARQEAPEETHEQQAPQAGAGEARPSAAARPFGIPPLEPLSIRTAEFDDVPALDQPMLVHADPIDFSLDSSRAVGAARFASTPGAEPAQVAAPPRVTPAASAAPAAPAASAAPTAPTAPTAPAADAGFTAVSDNPDDDSEDQIDEAEDFPDRDDLEPTVESSAIHAASVRTRAPPAPPAQGTQLSLGPLARPVAPPPAPRPRPSAEYSDRHTPVAQPNTSEKQKIVTLRVCAPGELRWSGADLLAALEVHALAHGRYQVFHRRHSDGRSIFCVASLVEPGTFDLSAMPDEEFRGVSLFAVLPGPLEPVAAIEAMLATARDLARELSGTMQDANGIPFSPQRVEALLQDVARFQAQLA